jgi:integral membrane protein
MNSFLTRIRKIAIYIYNQTHWFTNKEAWGVFRFFAILEAVGWTLLILAIVYRRVGLPEADSVVSFAGHLHGLGFGLYFIFVLLTARSMGWGIRTIVVAIIAGMPPYGSLIFEIAMARLRKMRPVYVRPPVGLDE